MKKLDCVLLIDDDEAGNMYNKFILEDTGIVKNIQITTNGKEALDYITNQGKYIENGTKYPKPDLILLDINMPVMDGFEFLEEYHNLPKEIKGEIIIVMLTTSLLPEDKEKATSYNEVSDFMNKPVTKEYISGIMSRYFS